MHRIDVPGGEPDLRRVGLVRVEGGQQRVPAVRGGLGGQHLLVELPGQAGASGLVRADGGDQAGGDAAFLGDYTDPGCDLLSRDVAPAAASGLEFVQFVAGTLCSSRPGVKRVTLYAGALAVV
ncbi:hypothetical protein [Streptomyces sioyaensis]|uniref:hypothetical protein n=1 Tax=Streptomyces sioyaensis TaxID=67364 RepID=UPI0036E0D48C